MPMTLSALHYDGVLRQVRAFSIKNPHVDEEFLHTAAVMALLLAEKQFDGRGDFGRYVGQRVQWRMIDCAKARPYLRFLPLSMPTKYKNCLPVWERRILLGEVCAALLPTERFVIRSLLAGESQLDIAARLGVTASRVSQVLSSIIQKARRKYHEKCI